jgi:hypothetical protein
MKIESFKTKSFAISVIAFPVMLWIGIGMVPKGQCYKCRNSEIIRSFFIIKHNGQYEKVYFHNTRNCNVYGGGILPDRKKRLCF